MKALHLVETLLRTARFFDPAACISWLVIDGTLLEHCVELALKSLFCYRGRFHSFKQKECQIVDMCADCELNEGAQGSTNKKIEPRSSGIVIDL